MHLSRILPLAASLLAGALAQQPPQPVISVNVGGQGSPQQPGVGPSPVAQQPGQQPGVIGAQPAAVTISPQGQGNVGQIGNGVPQPVAVPGQLPAGAVPGQLPAGGNVPVWVVKVGSERNELVFSPNQFNARPGEFIQFQFRA